MFLYSVGPSRIDQVIQCDLLHVTAYVTARVQILLLYTPVGTQRAYFELKYFKIVKIRDAKYSLKMAAEKWRQIFPFLNALYS